MTENVKIYYVDSRRRLNGTHSNFICSLNIPDNHDRMCLLSCSIPKSYYLIPKNTTFVLREYQDAINFTDITISIPAGNATRRSFQSVIINLLNANSINLYTYDILIPSSTQIDNGKFIYTINALIGGEQPPALIMPSSGSLHEIFGFEVGSINQLNAGTLSIESVNVCKLQKEDVLAIHCDDIKNQGGYDNILGSNNILSVVYSNVDTDFVSITYYNYTPIQDSRHLINTGNVLINFFITSENLEPIDLNGLNCVLTILTFNSKKEDDVLRMRRRQIMATILNTLEED